MSLYEKMKSAQAERDVAAFNACYHEDWEFLFHSTGRVMRREDDTEESLLNRWDTFIVEGGSLPLRERRYPRYPRFRHVPERHQRRRNDGSHKERWAALADGNRLYTDPDQLTARAVPAIKGAYVTVVRGPGGLSCHR